jgi:RimJ/RimL family protein N-acetyltransferase
MKITLLAAEHASQYRELMLHGYQHAPDAFTSTPEERAAMPISWWAKRAADPAGMSIAIGAFSGEQLIGTVALEFSSKPKTRHKVQLIGMYVLEAWRGKGIGQQLVSVALEHAKARPGIALVTLTATEGNAQAIALYEAAGFRAFGVEPMAIRTPAGYRAKVHMWKAVASESSAA